MLSKLKDILRPQLNQIPEGVCCVCGHKLAGHVDEGEYYRCHHLALDGYQCECILPRMICDEVIPLEKYDLKKRIDGNPESIDKLIQEIDSGERSSG